MKGEIGNVLMHPDLCWDFSSVPVQKHMDFYCRLQAAVLGHCVCSGILRRASKTFTASDKIQLLDE